MSPAADGMDVEQPVFVFPTDGHPRKQNQIRKAYTQGGKIKSMLYAEESRGGGASKRWLIFKLGHQGPPKN